MTTYKISGSRIDGNGGPSAGHNTERPDGGLTYAEAAAATVMEDSPERARADITASSRTAAVADYLRFFTDKRATRAKPAGAETINDARFAAVAAYMAGSLYENANSAFERNGANGKPGNKINIPEFFTQKKEPYQKKSDRIYKSPKHR